MIGAQLCPESATPMTGDTNFNGTRGSVLSAWYILCYMSIQQVGTNNDKYVNDITIQHSSWGRLRQSKGLFSVIRLDTISILKSIALSEQSVI
jgi:hypothetical protein